jgi:FixJ family two-component response regulator
MEPTARKLRPLIRIVDDDASVRRALTRLLASMGLRAEAYAGPTELLESEAATDVACLLLDVQLPGMTGFELHEQLCSTGPRLPVIFITAHPDSGARERAERAGAIAFLEKPFDDEQLLASIRSAIERSR